MVDLLQDIVDFVTANPFIFQGLISVMTSFLLVTYVKRYFPIDDSAERKHTNAVFGVFSSMLCTVLIYSGPHKLTVVIMLAFFSPLFYLLISSYIEHKAMKNKGVWMKLLKFIKPHRVNPSPHNIKQMRREGKFSTIDGEDVVLLKPKVKVKRK